MDPNRNSLVRIIKTYPGPDYWNWISDFYSEFGSEIHLGEIWSVMSRLVLFTFAVITKFLSFLITLVVLVKKKKEILRISIASEKTEILSSLRTVTYYRPDSSNNSFSTPGSY